MAVKGRMLADDRGNAPDPTAGGGWAAPHEYFNAPLVRPPSDATRWQFDFQSRILKLKPS